MEIQKNHKPENPEFYKPEETIFTVVENKEVEVPKILFEGLSREDAEAEIRGKMDFHKESGLIDASRLLDETEITELKETILDVTMFDLPEASEKLEEITAKAKAMVNEAKEAVNLAHLKINDAVRLINEGKTKAEIKAEDCFILPIGDKMCYYAFVGEQLKLIKTKPAATKEMLERCSRNNPFFKKAELKALAS